MHKTHWWNHKSLKVLLFSVRFNGSEAVRTKELSSELCNVRAHTPCSRPSTYLLLIVDSTMVC